MASAYHRRSIPPTSIGAVYDPRHGRKIGRTHQLRVHLQSLQHPILGDELYASAAVCAQAPRLLLHASQIRLPHPLTGATLSVNSAVPF